MKFPLVLVPELSDRQLERYRRHIDSGASGWYRRFTESIWRRHQHPSNAHLSGWRGEQDQKRRLLHFYDEYGLVGRSFVLKNAFLHLNLTLPRQDIEEYQTKIAEGLALGGWQKGISDAAIERWQRGDLIAWIRHTRVHALDERHKRAQPEHYRNLDLVLRTEGYPLAPDWEQRPFDVFFKVGLRKKLEREEPKVVEAAALAEYLPAQVELGCGPSIEAGIPHLSTLHRIYGVSQADYGFIFRAEHDGLLTVFSEPEAKYREMTDIYRACLTAEQTPFYTRLHDLWQRGHLVGPIITNNFDCQCADLGLPEISLRRYDWEPYYPQVAHDPRAKSLLVIGVHADRRLVQMRARERGLRVLYVDPESYVGPSGQPIVYPVEAPQKEDLFVRATAHDAFERLHTALVR